VSVNVPSVLTVEADAIDESCTSSASGSPTASADIADATVTVGGTPITVPVDPGANTTIDIDVSLIHVADLVLNQQTLGSDGSITANAISLTILAVPGFTAGTLLVGSVSCGPNADTVPTPTFVARGLPFAGAVVLVGGASAFAVWRRRRTHTADLDQAAS